MIDKNSIIHPGAKIATSASVGPFCVIGPKVIIRENVIVQYEGRKAPFRSCIFAHNDSLTYGCVSYTQM